MRRYLFFLICILVSEVVAQDPTAIHLTEKDGLPDVEFYDLYEDTKGFIWLAADKGLFKYDGKDFINYSHPDKRGLSVFDIIEDDSGRIWCKNITGQIFYVENNTMHLFYDLDLKRYGEKVQIFFRDNMIVLISLDDYIAIDFETKKVQYQELLKESQISVPFEHQGNIYKNFDTSFVKINNYKEDSEVLFQHEDMFRRNSFNNYMIDGETTLLFRSNNKELFHLDIEAGSLAPIKLPQDLKQLVWAKLISAEGYLWFCTNKGVVKYRIEHNKLVYVNAFLKPYFVSDLLIDSDQNYWISTIDAGVFVIPNIHVKKHTLAKEVSNLKALKTYKEGQLLLGSFNGSLGSYDPVYQEYKLITKGDSKISDVFYQKNKDFIFSSTDRYGFTNVEKYKKGIKRYGNLKDISAISDTSLLVASYNRTAIITRSTSPPLIIEKYLNTFRTYSCHYDATTKNYYSGTTDNLKRYDSLYNEFVITYKEKPLFVLDMDQTENGTLWVTTHKNGVLGIKKDSVVASFNVQNGLPTNKTSFLYADKEYLWVATQEGVAKINTISEEVRVLTKQDGIPSYKIEAITSIGDEVYFASNEGLFSVGKNEVFIERKVPQVYFTAISIADKETLLENSYNIPHDKNRIEIEFHSNGFQTDKNLVYEYQLNEQPKTWETLDSGVNNVTFGNLEDGDYTFLVRARNVFNNKVSTPKTVSFKVALPYWERWWFLSLTICCSLLLMALYFRTFQKRKEKERSREVAQLQLNNQLTSLKLENLRSQMNPHFIFNALNSIQEYIVLNQRKLASDYLGKFADLVRTYLKHSNQGEISLQEEIDCLEMYLDLEKLRFEEKLAYTISSFPELHPEAILIPTMLIQPYVENAIKHGLLHKKTDRKLQVSFYFGNAKDVIICDVEDNGVGRERAKEFQKKRKPNHQSFATQATDDRLGLINKNSSHTIGVFTKDLYDTNKQACGTKVTITIPYKKD